MSPLLQARLLAMGVELTTRSAGRTRRKVRRYGRALIFALLGLAGLGLLALMVGAPL